MLQPFTSGKEPVLLTLDREAGTAILQVAYGYQTEAEGKDPLVDLAGRTMENFAAATVPGKFAVDMLPFCTKAVPPVASTDL